MKFLRILINKFLIFLLNLGCYLNLPIINALIIYFATFKSKKIRFDKVYKKTAIILYRANGVDDIESTFEYYKSKNRILFLGRVCLKTINNYFETSDKITIHQYLKKTKNKYYINFLSRLIKWLKFFLGDIYFISFNFAFSEEFNLRDACFKEKVAYLIAYKECIRTKGNYKLTFGKLYKNSLNFNQNILKISVYNEDMKRELIKNNIFNKNQIFVTGMPRSSYLKKEGEQNLKKNIVFFLISKTAGIPQNINIRPSKLKNFNWDKINETTIKVFSELSKKYPEINFIIKSKEGISKKDKLKIVNQIKRPNIKFYVGGSGHKLVQSSFIVIAFNSTTVYEGILNRKQVIVPYLKEYNNGFLKNYVHEYPDYLCIRSKKELTSRIESLITNKKIKKTKLNKKEKNLITKYLGNVEKAPKNMRQFLNI